MNRRDLLRSGALLTTTRAASLFAENQIESGWRKFEVTTRVEIGQSSGPVRVWLPTPLTTETSFQKSLTREFHAEGAHYAIARSGPAAPEILTAKFPSGVKPVLTLTSRIATRDYAVNLSAPVKPVPLSRAERDRFLRPTKLLPTDGIVKSKALEITKGATTDLDKARALYDWIVDNTFRNPKTRGCGIGDIRFMLESMDLGGKCADLNALYVGLARAAGLPARDVYGIRVAKSELGYISLGAASSNITRAQHCRAEVYLTGYGWVPVDPADVRKVVLEEPPGNRALNDEMVTKARARLFGSWEMNWIAYNFSHDVALPGSSGRPLGFLMYPQAETASGRLDSLDPDAFRYEITATAVSS